MKPLPTTEFQVIKQRGSFTREYKTAFILDKKEQFVFIESEPFTKTDDILCHSSDSEPILVDNGTRLYICNEDEITEIVFPEFKGYTFYSGKFSGSTLSVCLVKKLA